MLRLFLLCGFYSLNELIAPEPFYSPCRNGSKCRHLSTMAVR